MKNSLVILLCLMLSACLFPIIPTLKGGGSNEVSDFIEFSKNKTTLQIEQQMLDCGYGGHDSSTCYIRDMPRVDYIQANICMEKHGFRSRKNKSLCHNKWFISTGGQEAEAMCQAWLKEFKR